MTLTLTKQDSTIFIILGLLVASFWFLAPLYDTNVYLIFFFILIGLFIAIFASEKAVKGMEVLGNRLGLTPYVSGVLASLASNTPELVIGLFAVLKGETEFAIAFIIIATGFNFLMLGILIIIGNRKRKGPIEVPDEVLKVEVPIVRIAIVMTGAIFVLGVVLFAQEALDAATTGNKLIPYLPYEAALISVVVYLFYLYFIIKHNLKEKVKNHSDQSAEKYEHLQNKKMLAVVLLLAFAFIFFAGEMISRSVEIFLELPNNPLHMNQFQLAFIIGAAASIPEHAIALMAVRHEGGIELGMGNLIAGSMQNLLLMTGLVALFSYIGAKIGIAGNSLAGIPLIHEVPLSSGGFATVPFLLVQFGFAWLMLFLIKSSMTDDQKLDSYEGFTITMAQLFVFIIFLQAILNFKLLG